MVRIGAFAGDCIVQINIKMGTPFGFTAIVVYGFDYDDLVVIRHCRIKFSTFIIQVVQ